VINRHRLAAVGCSGVAVSTVSVISLKQLVAESGRQITHGLELVGRRNLMPSPLQQGSSMRFSQHVSIKFGSKSAQFCLFLGGEPIIGILVN
jgi:hypothetical protein